VTVLSRMPECSTLTPELGSWRVSEVRVREARPDDAVRMASIYVEAARGAWGHIFGASNLLALEPPIERLRSRISGAPPHENVLVADVDGKVRGFAIVRPCDDEDANPVRDGELDMIYTDPDFWGQGTGRTLLVAAVSSLGARGFRQATLWTAEENLRPRRVYEAAGWKRDGVSRERSWRGITFRELRYRLVLDVLRAGQE